MGEITAFPDAAPSGYVWVIAEHYTPADSAHSYLRIRSEFGRYAMHSHAKFAAKAHSTATMLLTPLLIENFPVICEDDEVTGSAT
jgi:hypothetical protein